MVTEIEYTKALNKRVFSYFVKSAAPAFLVTSAFFFMLDIVFNMRDKEEEHSIIVANYSVALKIHNIKN